MLNLIVGYWVSKMIHEVARLGVADHLRAGPLSAAELARIAGADAAGLQRVLRALASVGVFSEDTSGRFALTPLGETLRSDRPDSLHDFALMMCESYNWQAWDRLHVGVTGTGVPFRQVFGMQLFEYLAQHPPDEAVFGRSMTSISGAENPAVAAALDLSGVRSLVDVGGSRGHLLDTVLRRHVAVRGVLFDLPQVVAGAAAGPYLGGEIAERVSFVGGSFFEGVPHGHDAYMMKYVLHDWNDDECAQILTHCRKAMAPGGRVLVVDTVIEPGNAPQWGKLLDINMMVLTGGRERTAGEFAELFERVGLRLEAVIPTGCPVSVMVGRA
jgi:hypothetical protein